LVVDGTSEPGYSRLAEQSAEGRERTNQPAHLFEALPMWLLRSAIVIVITTLWAASSARVSPTVERRTKDATDRAVHLTVRPVLAAPFPGREPTAPFSTFRLRRKAVLEETQIQVIPDSDLGPVPSPDRFLALLPSAPMPGTFATSLPLRC
jgi:hypothetical protein